MSILKEFLFTCFVAGTAENFNKINNLLSRYVNGDLKLRHEH